MAYISEIKRHPSMDSPETRLIQATLDLLANKWSSLVICALKDGPLRFGQLRRRLEGISPKVLTTTLRRLQEFGIVERVVYPAVPLHVEYSLTELGVSSTVPLRAVITWVESNIDQIGDVSPASTAPSADPSRDSESRGWSTAGCLARAAGLAKTTGRAATSENHVGRRRNTPS